MKYLALYIIPLLLLLLSFTKAKAQDFDDGNQEYFGADHNEASMTIPGVLIVNQAPQPTAAYIDGQVRSQMRYMLGLMRSREHQAAALYPKWTYKVSEIKKTSAASYTVKYDLQAKGIFARGINRYTFTIPLNPYSVFAASQKKCMVEKNVEDSFYWYHWEPLIAGCPLKENVDYYNATVNLTPILNTQRTFPEYQKLVDSNNTIKVTMFFGLEKYDYMNWTPQGDDWGIKGYNKQRETLKAMGFAESIWNRDQVLRIYSPKSASANIPYVIEMNLKGAHSNIRIRLVLSDTGYAHNSAAFHAFLKEALANESVVIYDGHSGIGKNMDLAGIEKLRNIKLTLNPKYQILFFGSCVPYAYYTDMYFARKKSPTDPNGTLNLDIFTYGQESVFANDQDRSLTQALVRWAQQNYRTSYQEIIGSGSNYYFGINGDEDNPKN
jgi:hypothetical protein